MNIFRMAGWLLPVDRKRWPQFARECFEERAAIKEHDGKMTREQAEKEAENEIRVLVERNFLKI
jgi:pantothenate kinase